MCGIGGWIGSQDDGATVAHCMRQALHHRGPDGYGVRSFPAATLVHTRLSIIDLSKSGAQPMANETGTIWTAFNGEIYNHRELRIDLERKGHHFRGHSDSEVIPHLYEELGPGFVERLRGMFAIAIYDVRAQTLLLARDRFGIKPLFYALTKTRLAFASELRALRCVKGIDTRPNRQAIYDSAALFYIPAPETFYQGICALQAGEILEASLLQDGAISWKTRRYWKGVIAPDQGLSLSEAVDQAEGLLTTAIQRQLESDVPLGALLSGGIDSSLVSAAAQRALQGTLRTYNVRFFDRKYDETAAALAVAQHIGSHHVTLDMDEGQGTWEHVIDLLTHAGQPFADTSLFGVNAVCRLMRTHVTVALSGDGGDEGFGGYDIYWRLARIAKMQHFPAVMWKASALALDRLAKLTVLPAYLPARFREVAQSDDVQIVQGLFSVQEEELRGLCLDYQKMLPIRRFFEQEWEHCLPRKADRVERLSALATEVNVRMILANDFLFKVDLASMKESLEVRVPMLDEELFSFGLTLPHRLKVKGSECKQVLRKIAERQLPRTIAEKSKHGFGVPVDRWVNADFRSRVRETLLGSSSRLPELFRPEGYESIVEAFCGGRPDGRFSRSAIFRRTIFLLSIHLHLEGAARSPKGNVEAL